MYIFVAIFCMFGIRAPMAARREITGTKFGAADLRLPICTYLSIALITLESHSFLVLAKLAISRAVA